MSNETNSFNIITFDGGGIKGALSVALLNRLNEHYPALLDKTSLLGGTSTGSFIAIALAYGLPISKILDIYANGAGEYIFSKSYTGIIKSKYSTEKVKDVLLNLFPKNLTLGDLKKFVVIPTFYLGDNENEWRPIFYNNIPGSPTENCNVIDVMLYSSAAPIYFPIYKNHIDGGIIANNPSLACLIHALDDELVKKIESIKMISIGTGHSYNRVLVDNNNWGAIDWIINKEPPYPVVSIALEGNSKFSQVCTSKLLGENYIRVDPYIDSSIGLDNYKSIQNIINIGEECNIDYVLKWICEKWN